MLAEVNKSLRRITIPDVSFGNKDYSQKIVSSFGSHRVSESQIDGLKGAQREAVAAIIDDLESEVNAKVEAIEDKLDTTGQTFVENMCRDIQESLSRLREDIVNKAQRSAQIAAAREAVAKALAAL